MISYYMLIIVMIEPDWLVEADSFYLKSIVNSCKIHHLIFIMPQI